MATLRAVVSVALLAVSSAWPVSAQCPDGTPPPCNAIRRTAPAPLTLAVLDFRNLSPGDSIAAAQATAFSDELMERLRLIPRFRIVARSAVVALGPRAATMTPAQLGRSLQAQLLISGTVRRLPGRVRITSELVRASTGQAVWTQTMERTDADLPTEFAIQLAAAALGTVRDSLGTAERAALAPATDSAAFEAGTIALLPFTAPDGDTAATQLAERATEALTRRFQDGNRPRATDPAEVRDAIMRFGAVDSLTNMRTLAWQIGRFTRAPEVVTGVVRHEGARLHVTVALHLSQTRRSMERSATTASDSVEAIAQILFWEAWLGLRPGLTPESRAWMARRNPAALRLYFGPPSETARGTRDRYWRILALDSMLVHGIFSQFGNNLGAYAGSAGGARYWLDTLALAAYKARSGLPAEDGLGVETLIGPLFGLADDLTARLRLFARFTEEAPSNSRAWEHRAAALAAFGPLTSIPDWRAQAGMAINRGLVAHDTCATVVDLAFWFSLFQGDTMNAARFANIVQRKSWRGRGAVSAITGFDVVPHALAAVRGDLSDTLFWMKRMPVPAPGRDLLALARAVPSAVPTADVLANAFERTEFGQRPGWNHSWLAYYWRDRGDHARWVRHIGLSHQVNDQAQMGWLDNIASEAYKVREVIYMDVPENAVVRRTVALMTRIVNGDSVPAPDSTVVGISHCWLAQWRLAHGDTSGAGAAIAYLRLLEARDRAGRQDGLPNVHRWSICPAMLDALVARQTGKEQLAKARALDALLRPGPSPRRGLLEGLAITAAHDQTRLLENLMAGRLLAAAGDTAAALAAVRRRPREITLIDNLDNLIDYVREEGRFAAAMGETFAALQAYEHYMGLRPQRPAYEPWAREWDAVRAEMAALKRP